MTYDQRYEERWRDEAQREFLERWTLDRRAIMERLERPPVWLSPPIPEPVKRPDGT